MKNKAVMMNPRPKQYREPNYQGTINLIMAIGTAAYGLWLCFKAIAEMAR